MSQAWVGKCLLQKSATGKVIQTARIIYVNLAEQLVAYVPFPKHKGGRINNYVPTPRVTSITVVANLLDDSDKCVLVDFNTPEQWLWTDAQLDNFDRKGSPLIRHRRELVRWKEVRDASYELIRPFVEGRSMGEILLDESFKRWPNERAQELGLKSSVKIKRALHAYLLGLADKRALMPGYANCGAPGKQKFSTKTTGRPTIAARMLGEKKRKPSLSQDARVKLTLGWKRHKAKGVSDRVALGKTLNDYFVKSVTPAGSGLKVTLKPEAFDITPQMFRYWGLRDLKTLRPMDLERGLTSTRDEIKRRQRKASERFDTLNGVGYIDSTSTDQTLMSSIHPLKRLKSPWRTEVLGSFIDYIFGMYVGFEPASATTALLAILHAATDKVEFCARFGYTIEPRDWHSCTFNNFEMDNGEGKGKLVLSALQDLAISASYGASYDAINKAAGESGHRQRQKRNDHLLPGTTMGRHKVRGEADRAVAAGLRFDDYMHFLIGEILHHNNEAYIDPPRLEMYPGLKERTRRGVVEWLIDHHYLSSSPVDLNVLKVTCLPRFKAVIHRDGIHLYVPGTGGNRLIRKLVYSSEYLYEQGHLHESSRKVRNVEVHLNPVDLSHVWANLGGLRRFDLVSGDRDFAGVTLIDWLAISEDDKLAEFLARRGETQYLADKLANIDHRHKQGKEARKEEARKHGKPTKTEIRSDVRLMTEIEKAVHTAVPPKPIAASEFATSAKAPSFRVPPSTKEVPRTQLSTDHWIDIAVQIYEDAEGGRD